MAQWVTTHRLVTACLIALVLTVAAIVFGGVQCAAEWAIQ